MKFIVYQVIGGREVYAQWVYDQSSVTPGLTDDRKLAKGFNTYREAEKYIDRFLRGNWYVLEVYK